MPYSFGSNPTEEEYDAAASMIAQIGAAEIKYGIGGGSAPIKTILEKYFKYNNNLKFVYREEYTKTEWENIFKNELSSGRPILIEGTAERYDDGNWAGHFYVCDGYSADNKFHTDLSIGEIEWWTDIDNFEYGKNQCALIYAEPDWQGKTLSLDYPKGDEYFQKLTEIELKWSSTNINNVLLEYSNDAGKNWHKIAENVDASTGNYNWTLPDVASEEYKIRISDSENGNVYQRCKTFNVFNQQSIAFYYPLKNTYFQAETTQPIYWNSEGIQSFKLEYSTGQNNWELLSDAVIAKSGVSNCIMPDLNEDKVILKATDLSNSNLFFLTDTFKIKSEKLIGGVNNSDEQTVLLMHFEENIENSANNYLTPNESVSGSFSENYNLALGKAYRIDNSKESINGNYMWVTNAEDIDLGNNLTVEAWVNIQSIGDYKTGFFPIIIEKAESFGIYVYQDFVGNELNGFHSFVNFSNGSKVQFFQRKKIELDKWYHVAMISDASSGTVNFFVHDENRNLIYKDSNSFPSGSDGEIKQNDNLIYIGGLGGASNRQFDGFMDEVRISKSSNLEDYLETTELPFYDDFSQNYLNWTTFSATGIDQWHISNDDGIDFSKCARFYITSNPQQTNDDWLITPVFNSVEVSKLVVSFCYIYAGNGIKPEYYYASSFNTNPANSEWTKIDNSFLGEVGPWNDARIEITDPADKFVFAIRYQSSANDSYYYLMDNFKIEEISTNLEKTQLAETNFKIYPNPITHESVISFSTKSVDRVILSIYDLQGRMICNLLDKKMNTGTHTIPLGNQIKSNGVYLCKLSTSEGVSILKLVVK
jgi:hypothetical protein